MNMPKLWLLKVFPWSQALPRYRFSAPQIFAVHAQVNPDKDIAAGIGIDEVVNAIQRGKRNLPTGTLYGPTKKWDVTPMANFIMPLPIAR